MKDHKKRLQYLIQSDEMYRNLNDFPIKSEDSSLKDAVPKLILSITIADELKPGTKNIICSSYVYQQKYDLRLEVIIENMSKHYFLPLIMLRVYKPHSQDYLEDKIDGIDYFNTFRSERYMRPLALYVKSISETYLFGVRENTNNHFLAMLKEQKYNNFAIIFVFENYT